MSQLTYRYASPADVARVVALVESAYRGQESRAGWTSEADLIAPGVRHPGQAAPRSTGRMIP